MTDDDTTGSEPEIAPNENAPDTDELSLVKRLGPNVLKRDATKTDYIVIPVAAGVIASCLLAVDDAQLAGEPVREYWQTLRDSARAVLSLCEEEREDEWNVDAQHYITLWGFIHLAWVALVVWSPIEFVLKSTGMKFGDPAAIKLQAAERWLREHPEASFVECMLVAGYACDIVAGRRVSGLPFLERAARPIRVELARRLRQEGLTSWPQIVRAVRAQWNLETLQRLAIGFALSFGAEIGNEDDAPDAKRDREERALQHAEGVPAATDGDVEHSPATDIAAHERTIATQARMIRELEETSRRLQQTTERLDRERTLTAERHAGADSYAAALKRELADANAKNALLETAIADLRRTNERLKEDIAVEAAFALDAPLPAANTFEGRRVLLFTGHARADTREAMRQSFLEFGAQDVDCYWSDRSRGPESYPKDSIVVIDVTFMSHSTSKSIEDRALKSGAWCMLCRRGAALIGREAAARFQAVK